jgi:hypothetical protein
MPFYPLSLSSGKLRPSIERQFRFALTHLWKITVLSALAFLFVSTTSFTSACDLNPSCYSYQDSNTYKLLRANMVEYASVFVPASEYDQKVETAVSGIVSDFLNLGYMDEIYNGPSEAALWDFEAPMHMAYVADLAYLADSIGRTRELETYGDIAHAHVEFEFEPHAVSDTVSEIDNSRGGYYYRAAGTKPPDQPEHSDSSSSDKFYISSLDSGDDGVLAEISDVGNSPFSTRSTFESFSISGTYPDSDIIEVELPPILRLGDKRIIVGAGWMMPSGLQIPLGTLTDGNIDDGAYYLSLVLRF